MCGINGLVSHNSQDKEDISRKVELMNDRIIHRGPDDHGVFSDKSAGVAMGMRRLSIIDLTSGHQPMYSEEKKHVIVFNGEIYNYRELKAELITKGAVFRTKSDTEVILQLYLIYGTKGFQKLDGMFAFSIYDTELNKIFIGRDFFGEKPLYYSKSENGFFWASELKSLLRVHPGPNPISIEGLNLFFRLTYIPAPFTIYENVFKLNPNSLLSYDLEKRNYTIEEIVPHTPSKKEHISFEEAKKNVRQLVEKSVDSRSVADVPIGTFLSGGVDSSVVSLCLSRLSSQKINTFSIGFQNKGYDETEKSQTVAKLIGSNHHEFVLKEKDLGNHVHEILTNFDEPFADSSSMPSFLVAQQTSRHLKVALTGDGGDEVFGGYNKYYMGRINNKYTQLIPKQLHNLLLKSLTPMLSPKSDKRGKRFRLNRLLHAVNYSDQYYWDIISLGFPADTIVPYLKSHLLDTDIFKYYREKTGILKPTGLTDYREIDRNMSLEGDMLVKVDRTSMLNSLECRAPFLNKDLWNYTSKLPEEYLLKGWDKKYILKEAFKEDFPNKFLDKSKAGFGVPIGDWLRSSLKKELLHYGSTEYIEKQGIFNSGPIHNLVRDHLNGKDHTFKVWSFYCFQKWYENQSA